MVDPELELPGGASGLRVVRVGDTVRRPLHENAPFVHALLRHFEAVGFEGAPRFLGIDEEGREILSYVEGRVYPGPDEVDDQVVILGDEHLVSAGRLIRRFHDATAGTALAGAAEVVCHPDLGQHNIVFVGNDAKAIIDGTRTSHPARVSSTSLTPSGASPRSGDRAARSKNRRAAHDFSATPTAGTTHRR